MKLFWAALLVFLSPLASACAVTLLVSNRLCAPEMTAPLEVSLPMVMHSSGTAFAVLHHEAAEAWVVVAVGPTSAIENPNIQFVPQFRSWVCADRLYVPYVAMPSGEPVRNIVLKRDAVNWLRWRVQAGAEYPAVNPC